MITAIIPARGGSKRIPRKNLIDFCNKPLVYWSIKQALDSKMIDRVYVSTEDKEIAQVAKDYGADIIKRPSELAQDGSTLEDVLYHALGEIKDIDVIVALQPTSPLRMPDDIDNAIRYFKKHDLDSVISTNIEDDIFLFDKCSFAVTFNFFPRQKIGEYYRENGSFYIMKSGVVGGFDRYGKNIGFYHMQKWQSFEIDTMEDVEICEYFMRKKILNANCS